MSDMSDMFDSGSGNGGNGGNGGQKFPQKDYVLTTERVYNELKDSKEVDFKLLGIFELRGLTGLHRIYEVTPTK